MLRSRFMIAVGLAALVALGNVAYWFASNRPVAAPEIAGRIHGFSYEIYQPGQEPGGKTPTREQIDADMAFLSRHSTSVRTYASADAHAPVAEIARRHGMTVTLGIWIGPDRDRNRTEIEAGVAIAKANPNVTAILVGNEPVLRGDANVAEIAAYMAEVRKRTGKPVSVAEPWAVFMDSPELARAADFLAIHVLPYWEGVSNAEALPFAKNAIQKVRAAYPEKPIIVTETGWPSNGRRTWSGTPDLKTQATFVRGMLDFARREHVDMYVLEAFDQEWKYRIEGAVGAYWGVFDSERNAKFPLTGAILPRPHWPVLAAGSTLVGLLLMAAIAVVSPNRPLGLALQFSAAQMALVGLFHVGDLTASLYFTAAGGVAWGALIAFMLALILVLCSDVGDLAGVIGRRLRRTPQLDGGGASPVASVHLPIHAEPPTVVAETLRSLAQLEYPDFEVIVIDNNTADEALWRPVEQLCKELNQRLGKEIFRFMHRVGVTGFKAGALNIALAETRADAELIAVIDADYVVSPDWLKRCVPAFADRSLALLQAPQDHRDSIGTAFKRAIGWEYAGFFYVGMRQRNEDNAIIQHGTMCIIRRQALESVGGWATWCITEDAELGLRLQATGWNTLYTAESFGHGLSPDTFAAYAAQRYRWAYGAIRILAHHWRMMLPRSPLSSRQRLAYVVGWLPWIGDALGLVFALVSLPWTLLALLLPGQIELPPVMAMVPVLAAFGIRLSSTLALYGLRVPCTLKDAIMAALAGLSLAPTIGCAVLHGVVAPGLPFRRTPKATGLSNIADALKSVRLEAQFVGAVLGLLSALAWERWWDPEACLWAITLVVQAVPFAAALCLAMMTREKAPATLPHTPVARLDPQLP